MYTHTPGSGPRAWNNSQSTAAPEYSELYFSYASNLSPQTMKGRHPNSLFAGLAVLPRWKWTINAQRFANIEPSDSDSDVVYGAIYFITGQDEAGLDDLEGAPDFYQKQSLEVTRTNGDGSPTEQKVNALVYIDTEHKGQGTVAPEYVVWLRKAIRDAKPFGLPDAYVDKYIRSHLPANEDDEVEKDMEPVRMMFSRNAFK